MRFLVLLLVIGVGLISTGNRAKAQNYPWCAIYSGKAGGGTNCGFISFEQCMDTARGLGSFCRRIRNTYLRQCRIPQLFDGATHTKRAIPWLRLEN